MLSVGGSIPRQNWHAIGVRLGILCDASLFCELDCIAFQLSAEGEAYRVTYLIIAHLT